MDTAKLNDWMQVVGMFSVVASLIFVGLQMRQDRDIALSVATQSRTDTTIQSLVTNAQNPYYMSAVDKIASGNSDSLLPSEHRAISMVGSAALFNFENVHFQYLNGYVPEERWSGTRAGLKGLLSLPYGPRITYENNPSAWRQSFQEIVNGLLAEIDAESGSQ